MKKDVLQSLSELGARLEIGDMAALAWPLKAAGACAVAAVAFGLAWSVWAAPARQEIAAAERREAQLGAEYARKRALADELPTLRAANERALDEFARLLRRLPERAEVPGLLESITRAAVDSGMTIERLDLGEERAGGPSPRVAGRRRAARRLPPVRRLRRRRGGAAAPRHAARLRRGCRTGQ